ncbi:MAG: phosphate acyltransferase PlsX [Sulfurovum sp.]|nr:phosphate acyltransferase PlsX [Sulfurovum sp.]MCB4747588.1 phosphate acyltransferase PlsX [Sulfurovum sp.]MCB4749870.1 phosphate acyltransferase PlsX [Sulfurovum sp.]MCB4751288.1 phosphate acyltransferase PlsX [Sulfurovum sp.]MCB4752790.1 phosphate acyltransferase PlsX [Sulfurovum sp.]
MIKIAIDAMGGDFGSEPIIEGVVQALEGRTFLPILVGQKEEILAFLPQYYINKVEIIEASDVIDMADQATNALKRKDSSIYKAVELVRNKKADAVVSAGHSGATMTLATLRMGRLPHISKPALATLMPSLGDNKTLVLDVGAVTDCTPQNLYEFGAMGEAYIEKIFHIENPRVGLLSNGSEDSKGNALTKEAFMLLKNLKGFVGNVEGKNIFDGSVDVVVCDGFTGNILLKTSEGVVTTVFALMKQYIRKSLPAKIGALMMRKKVFINMKKEVDKDEYGGAPLLGIDGCAIISHGASNAKAIKNAIFQAMDYMQSDVNSEIESLLT